MTIAPLRREIRVGVDPATAYTVFTAHLGAWWPLGTHSVGGATSSVAIEGDTVVERTADGTAHVWAEVVEQREGERLRLSWHPGQAAGPAATDVQIDFRADGDGTLVTLVHSGWERTPAPEAMRENYRSGWVVVLRRFGRRTGAADDDGPRWFVLQHSRGPALPDGESVFAHPLFAEHVAFLDRLAGQGLLVAAGPLPDDAGSGMTIVRLLPEDGEIDVEKLASTDDQSVVGGLLSVQARPWAVRVSAV